MIRIKKYTFLSALIFTCTVNVCLSNEQKTIIFEGDLSFNKILDVNMEAGNKEYPRLLTIESIKFETSYGNAWGVAARIGWLPVIDSSWNIKAELLDKSGNVLHNSRDETTVFTCRRRRASC